MLRQEQIAVVTGVRRCGKSTLLFQVLKANYDDAIYLNFEDIRLAGFENLVYLQLRRHYNAIDQALPCWNSFPISRAAASNEVF